MVQPDNMLRLSYFSINGQGRFTSSYFSLVLIQQKELFFIAFGIDSDFPLPRCG
jgi:hypothetical protein